MNFATETMSRILEIAVNVFFLLVIVGFTGWILFRSLKRSDDPPRLIIKWIFTLLMLGFMFFVVVPQFREGGFAAIAALGLAGIWGISMAITWRHSWIDLVANPIASLYDGGREEVEPRPYYSIAIT